MNHEVQVAIIGGGAMGVGLLYHLAHEGWTDTVLLEKGELTSGSTWHAAGLVPHFIGSLNMAKVHAEAPRLYARLEEETGLTAGWHPTGAIRLALNDTEIDWFRYVQGVLDLVGVESHLLTPSEILEHQPLLNVDDVKLGFWTPNDGWSDPSSSTNAMARGARLLGANIERHTLVTAMKQLADGRWEVVTDKGRLVAEHVVNAAGCYAPQLGQMVGYDVPIVSVIHQYLVTEAIPEVAELNFDLPVIRDPRASCYYRREIDGLIVGPYERSGAKTYGVEGIDWDLTFYLTPPDHDVLMPWLELAAQRIPVFAEAGIRTTISGPITHTPDSGYLMGPAPGLKNYWICAGASIGVTQGPGAGKYLAQWMVHGQTEINVAEMDPRRFGPHTYPKGPFAEAKAIDEFHEMYQVRPPGEQRFAGRPIKITPLYERFTELGAQWMEIFGWERPQYFGPAEQHTFRRSNALDVVGEEVRGARERAGIADLTAFSKFEITGTDAATLLDRLSANKLPNKDGGIRLTHMLTSLGGIECEMTITRLSPERFYLNSSILGELHDLDWLSQHILENEDVNVRDLTDELAILAVGGPSSRDIIQPLTETDLSTESFAWLNAQEIDVAGVPCIALRVSYIGELGWELHHPIDSMLTLYDALVASGEPYGLVHYGSYAMNEMRIEKGYKAWGSELTTEITPVEARIERFVDQSRDFIGKEAVVARSKEQLSMVLVYCEVDTVDTECRGNEPVYFDGEMVGITTSGTWSHTSNKSLAFAYVDPELENVESGLEIQIMGERRPATVLQAPAVDPLNLKIKG
ncbi:MAG: FAD-dependent oxidoreductase [Actinomycetota bacterium]|nr:FAD-dependent oxidoreductase [Actinomycetota bacterium]